MLSTTLDLEANPFVATLKSVNAAVDKFQGKITAIASLFSGLRDAAEMASQVFEKFASTLELGGHLTDLSAATGETKGELLVLEQAFKNAGKGADSVGPFISKLHKALGGVNEEGKNTAAAFAALGTSAEALKGLSVNDQVQKLSKGFSSITDSADRGQVAINLFGKSGEELLAVFRDDEAIATARDQVGGLGAVMEKIAPILDNIGDALGAITLKFQQLTAGFIDGIGLTDGFSKALNKIDLTGIGEKLGQIAGAFVAAGKAMKELVPIVLSLGAGWLVSMAASQIASVGIIAAVQAVYAATTTAIRGIFAALGPLGLAVAALTYLWTKFHKTVDANPFEGIKKAFAPQLSSPGGQSSGMTPLGVGSMTARGLSAFNGVGGVVIGRDPVSDRIDRTNNLLSSMDSKLARLVDGSGKAPPAPRRPLSV